MSHTDSFIDEVTEEVRRDRQYALMRKYGWIAVLAVLLIVGGAAFNEWRKARDRAAAEALGDQLLAAMEIDDAAAQAAALGAIRPEGDVAAIVALLRADNSPDGTAMTPEARAALEGLANDQALAPVYRDLAALKLVMGGGLSLAQRREMLANPLRAGGPYRVLAEEQLALIEIEAGETDGAVTRLRALLIDAEASQALRQRASGLIVALGADPEQ